MNTEHAFKNQHESRHWVLGWERAPGRFPPWRAGAAGAAIKCERGAERGDRGRGRSGGENGPVGGRRAFSGTTAGVGPTCTRSPELAALTTANQANEG